MQLFSVFNGGDDDHYRNELSSFSPPCPCPCHFSLACRNLVSTNMGVRFRIPLQKLHPFSRAIHHRYSGNSNPQRPPHRTAARHFTSMSRLPMRPPKPPPGSGGHGYQQHRNFWAVRLAARLLKLRYILLGTAVGGGYTAKKVKYYLFCVAYCVRCKKIIRHT